MIFPKRRTVKNTYVADPSQQNHVTQKDIGDGLIVENNKIKIDDSLLADKQNATDANLSTSQKNIVGAINEVNSTKQNLTDETLQTTNKMISGAINELVGVSNTKANKSTSMLAGNGLSGGGDLSENRSLSITSDNNGLYSYAN